VRVHYNLNHPESSSLEWTILIAHIETQTEGNKNNHVVKIKKKIDFFLSFFEIRNSCIVVVPPIDVTK
jgi:hypothetical protein